MRGQRGGSLVGNLAAPVRTHALITDRSAALRSREPLRVTRACDLRAGPAAGAAVEG